MPEPSTSGSDPGSPGQTPVPGCRGWGQAPGRGWARAYTRRVTDIWIGLAGGVPIEAADDDIGGAFAHVLAPAEDEAELRAAAAEALAEHGLRLTDLDEAEPVRERLRSGRIAPELMELAIDAALEDATRIGDFYSYPSEDDEDAQDSPDLHALLESRTLVNLRGAAEYHDTIGYVVAIGALWALIQIVGAHGTADGFRAVKLGTLDEAEPIDDESSFLPRLLTARPLPVGAPAVRLDGTRQLLEGAQQLGALIYLVTEDMEPGAFRMFSTLPFGSRTKKRRTPQGSSVRGCTISWPRRCAAACTASTSSTSMETSGCTDALPSSRITVVICAVGLPAPRMSPPSQGPSRPRGRAGRRRTRGSRRGLARGSRARSA